jgi:hypothetical protein
MVTDGAVAAGDPERGNEYAPSNGSRSEVLAQSAPHLRVDVEDPSTARASFYLYNTRDDVDEMVSGLGTALELFGAGTAE